MSTTIPPSGNGAAAQPQTETLTPFVGQQARVADKADFRDRIDQAIENMADVTVATLVTNVGVTVDERGRLKSVTAPGEAVPAMITNVNLIDGNVTTVIGPTLKDDATMGAFHQDLVDKAVKVLPDNLKALADLVESFFRRTKPSGS